MPSGTFNLGGTHTTQSVGAFGGENAIYNVYNGLAAVGDHTIFALDRIWEGPAILDFVPRDSAGADAMVNWLLEVFMITATNVATAFMWRDSSDGANPSGRHTGLLYLPPAPVFVNLTNRDATPKHYTFTLELDLARVG